VGGFLEFQPTRQNYWRAIILFGRNVASYKFALAQSLLELRDRGSDLVRIDDLAEPFARHLCGHLALAPKQSTSPSSRFLKACSDFNQGALSKNDLVLVTAQLGFNHVLDAFHVVNQHPVDLRFFIDERKENGGIRLTDDMLHLQSDGDVKDLEREVEGRWRLVETAWDLGVSRHLVMIDHDSALQMFTTWRANRRVPVTSSRSALNGYQKGRCFYCFDPISTDPADDRCADVDHFLPHAVGSLLEGGCVNGVWNLVLSCRECNRGPEGKFALAPSLILLERLHTRNEFLITSHHPLRETLIAQTGATAQERRAFLQARHGEAIAVLIHTWEPRISAERAF